MLGAGMRLCRRAAITSAPLCGANDTELRIAPTSPVSAERRSTSSITVLITQRISGGAKLAATFAGPRVDLLAQLAPAPFTSHIQLHLHIVRDVQMRIRANPSRDPDLPR